MEFLLQHSVVAFLIALTVLVFVHELGHYLVARLSGVRVEVFSIGFGPEIFGFNDSHGTRWKFSLIPLGGYVKMFGDTNPASAPVGTRQDLDDDQRKVAFWTQPLGRRTAIVAAGPLANFIFAGVVLAVLYMTAGQPYAPPTISEVVVGAAAEKAGLKVGDRIALIGDTPINSFEELQRLVRASAGVALSVTVERDGQTLGLTVIPNIREVTDTFGKVHRFGQLGVRSVALQTRQLSAYDALKQAVLKTGQIITDIMQGLWKIISGVRSVKELGGPLQIYQVSGDVAKIGLVSFISFLALLSVNLGLINLLPIPALDGGHLLFYAAEAIRGKPLTPRIQEMGALGGMVFVLGLVGLATWNDIMRLVAG